MLEIPAIELSVLRLVLATRDIFKKVIYIKLCTASDSPWCPPPPALHFASDTLFILSAPGPDAESLLSFSPSPHPWGHLSQFSKSVLSF